MDEALANALLVVLAALVVVIIALLAKVMRLRHGRRCASADRVRLRRNRVAAAPICTTFLLIY